MNPQADVLIVTATPVESRAVINTFAGLTGQLARAVPVGDRVYHDLGEVHGARVFLALTEMGAGGLGAAQQTVQKGIAALQPAAVILVGIAFGVDKQKQAIGDVLVSRQLLLYELQRVGEGNIVSRGDKPCASPWLLNYLNSAQLYWNEPAIAVRFGLVLSGEKLVDNLDYRKQLQQFEPEAIGGEMEGAGLYVACQDAKVDWVVVKAICDWADGHKAQDQDARQQLAAQNAVAFVAHAFQHVALRRPKSCKDAEKTENILLKECMKEMFRKEDDLREFCDENFEDVYHNLKETDRSNYVVREIIDYCKTRGITDNLWKLLQQRSPAITYKYNERIL